MTTNKWQTEDDGQAAEIIFKAHCVLEGSETEEWGLVKWAKGNINFIPDDAEVIGTWSKYADGVYWISITTPLEALKDRATQLFAELSAEREKELAELVTTAATPRRKAAKAKVVEEGPSEATLSIRALRDSLKKSE